jgi:aldehyde oxidoreductase
MSDEVLTLLVNGTRRSAPMPRGLRLLDALRRLGYTGAKEGCGEGECGACAVLLDGRPVPSCLVYAKQAEGKSIATVEGIGAGHEGGLHPFQRALIAEGGVQCGYCTPGMVVVGAHLAESRPSAGEGEIREGLSGNLCRCTGYAKIVGAVRRAQEPSAARPRARSPAMDDRLRIVGTPAPRVDAEEKVSGRARYLDDLELPGILHCAAATSAAAHAQLLGVDISEAEAMPGVAAVITARDVPGENQVGAHTADQPLLAVGKVRQLSDRIALVAAETPQAAREAARRVRATYRALPVVEDVEQALAEGAPRIHGGPNIAATKQVIRGDVDQAFQAAAATVEGVYRTDGGMTVIASAQAPFYVQKAVARALGVELARVRVVLPTTGGGFGGKEDYPSELAACAALLAARTRRPVKFVYRRDEDIAWSSKRHRMTIGHRLAADAQGRLLGARIRIDCDAGGYNGLSAVVAERANATAVEAPTTLRPARGDTAVVYTNGLFGGAFRGFGTPQVAFAMESQIDELARRLSLSPAEVRRRNMLDVGDETATGQRLSESAPGRETLERALERSGYEERRRAFASFNEGSRRFKRGIGIGCCLYGCGLHAGGQIFEGSGALLHVRPDGSAELAVGGAEIGQGAFTAVAQIAAEELGISLERVRVAPTSTALVPDSGPTVASRTTIMSGNAALDAARQVRARMLEAAAQKLGVEASALVLRGGVASRPGGPPLASFAEIAKLCFERKVPLTAAGWYAPPRKAWDEATGTGEAYSAYSFAAQVAEVEVDVRSGRARVLRFTAAHDVGKAVNPALVEGQIEGGVLQGIGLALMEELRVDGGRCLNPSFTDYLIPTSLDAPPIDVILIESPYSRGPFGAKGIGEPALIPAAAAVANAVSEATGHRFTELPLTPERVLLALEDGPERS